MKLDIADLSETFENVLADEESGRGERQQARTGLALCNRVLELEAALRRIVDESVNLTAIDIARKALEGKP